jgi:hypothetical protein
MGKNAKLYVTKDNIDTLIALVDKWEINSDMPTERSLTGNCINSFMGSFCCYNGPETECDKTFERCRALHNEDNFLLVRVRNRDESTSTRIPEARQLPSDQQMPMTVKINIRVSDQAEIERITTDKIDRNWTEINGIPFWVMETSINFNSIGHTSFGVVTRRLIPGLQIMSATLLLKGNMEEYDTSRLTEMLHGYPYLDSMIIIPIQEAVRSYRTGVVPQRGSQPVYDRFNGYTARTDVANVPYAQYFPWRDAEPDVSLRDKAKILADELHKRSKPAKPKDNRPVHEKIQDEMAIGKRKVRVNK